MKTRALVPMAVAAVLALALATPALATQVSDPDDVSGKLDLQTLIGTKADASAPLHIKVVTYGNWRKIVLAKSGPNRIVILFNTDTDRQPEYAGKISESGGTLSMSISGSGSQFEPLPVRHPNRHTITTVVPGSSPPNPDGIVRIAARSRFTNAGDCSTVCTDRIPNGGWLTVP